MGSDTVLDVMRLAIPAGLIAGALTGVVARVAMRIFARATDEIPRFTLTGTVAIIVIFAVVLGVPLGLIFVGFWPKSGPLAGLIYGLVLFLLLIALPFLLIPEDDATLRKRLTAIAAFLPVPLIYGYTLAVAAAYLVSPV